MNAYEALKAWCEKYLMPDEYNVVPESHSYPTTIYFTDSGVGFVCFDRDGDARGMGALDSDDMFEHINEVECEKESASEIVADPPMTSISGRMVRQMIEAYERNMNK